MDTMTFIDVHGHLSPPGERGGGPPALRDPAAAIERKRALGIRYTVIGSPVGAGSMLPTGAADNYRQSADQVKAHNELMARLVDSYPEALRTYAYVDPFGGDAMLAQARDLVADWRFAGLVVNTSIDGEYLGSPRAADFFALADELRVPVLLHPPAAPVGSGSFTDLAMVEHLARFNDVTAGVASIVCAGWLERYPDLVLVAAAGGGGLALLGEKLDVMAASPRPPHAEIKRPALRRPPSESLARIYVDTSNPTPAALAANVTAFGAGHVLFGTDAPPLMDVLDRTVRMVAGAGLPPADRELIAEGNAAALYGLPVAPAHQLTS
ncbi:amidohydrolase family protein [Pseudosporangium ferrugineum]|uniref:Aminocarboxymuconate-semialdehyde decarboxylase n=1 Tax=Pseudosporangium ferrugineum TaxID=439699 RepID=A0A2T0RXE2_9ACTN|nr:amidohydrolase family protein [Pseudosporangium ferrugineum]PRY25802.1 aminocarboxymuconate-semialdehyde decarboxylase [Pseudosporangium ferrugineum]